VLTLEDAWSTQLRTAVAKVGYTRRPLAYTVRGMLAGSYIGIAVVLMLSAAGPLAVAGSPWTKLVQGLVFGVALPLVVTAGGELATSNMMTLPQGVIGRSIGWVPATRTLAFSFGANVLGGFAFAAMVAGTGLLDAETPAGQMLRSVLVAKAEETSGELFWRGVLCNMLVCLAIWSGARLRSEVASLLVVFWCLLAFITSGFEHVVANMTTYGLGLIGGLPGATWADFGRNMAVVGLGNLVGGSVVVGAAYALIVGPSSGSAAPRTAAPTAAKTSAPADAEA
jgi:nitrite transporter NirC